MSIYVGNLSYKASQENLNEVFAEYVRSSEFSYPLIAMLLWDTVTARRHPCFDRET